MMILGYLLIPTILMSLGGALPKAARGAVGGGQGDEYKGHGVAPTSSGFNTGALLGGISGYSFGSTARSSGNSEEYPSGGKSVSSDAPGSAASETSANDTYQAPNNSSGLYSIAKVTIHQYPLSTSALNNDSQSPIMEDISLWVFDIDRRKANAATAAQCNLTWIASNANLSLPPATGQMTCKSENVDGGDQGVPNYSPKYNVTFQQQSESPLPGFNLFVTSG